MRPSSSARASAASSTTGPRLVLTRYAVGFISPSSRSPIRWRVSSVSGTCSETTSAAREQLVQRQRVDDVHAVRLGESRHGLADAAVADDAERQAGEAAAEHERRRPLPRLAAAQEAVAFRNTPREREHERDRHLGRRVGEHVGRVRHDDAAALAFVEVDVVEADGVVRDDAKLRPGGVEQLGVDAVGQHRHEAIATGHPREQLLARRRQLLVVDVERERPLELLPHALAARGG